MGKYSIFDPNDLVCVRFAQPNGSILKIFARDLRNGSPIDEKSRPSANQIPWRVFFASETVAQKFVEYHHAGEGAAGAHDQRLGNFAWESNRHPSLDGFDPSKDVPSLRHPSPRPPELISLRPY